MRTLAPFAVICVALLALVAWQLSAVIRDQTPAAAPPRPAGPLRSAAADVAPAAAVVGPPREARPAEVASRDEAEARIDRPFLPPAMPVVPAAVDEGPGAPPATQAAVHWAVDLQRSRAKERFSALRKTLVTDPDNEAVLTDALGLARELQWHNEACDLLARLVQLHGDDAALRLELATLLMQLERWLEAIPHLRLVVQSRPDNARAWYNLAIAHQSLGRLHDARATWDRVVALMPDNPDVYAHRGEILLDLRAWSDAAADFETALRLEPGSIDTAMNLSLARYKLGRLDEARLALLPVLEHYPRHIPVLNRLAEIAWALYCSDPAANETTLDETVDYCLRSLTIDADQPEVTTLLKRVSKARD